MKTKDLKTIDDNLEHLQTLDDAATLAQASHDIVFQTGSI